MHAGPRASDCSWMGRWLDRLFIRSGSKRRERQLDRETAKRDADAIAGHQERQAHYRQVTGSDERGRPTGSDPNERPSTEPPE